MISGNDHFTSQFSFPLKKKKMMWHLLESVPNSKWNLIPVYSHAHSVDMRENGASILHILWACPTLKDWWNNIQEIMVISKVWKQILPNGCPLFFSVSMWQVHSDFSPKRQISLALTTVKWIILRHWRKKNSCPTVKNIRNWSSCCRPDTNDIRS